jgi:serine/threonine protein phosphatase 1
MTYVISDIHGSYESFIKMLKLIGFSNDDRLIILGDICDRGADSAEIYLDVMKRKNVLCLKGNHELMAASVLPYMFSLEPKKSRSQYKGDYERWMDNGGEATLLSLYRYSDSARIRILEYIKEMPLYLELKVGEREFILVHAGLEGYEESKPLDSYTPKQLLWARQEFDTRLWEDKNKFLIVGHTPTMMISRQSPPMIYKKCGIIDIDCGEAYRRHGGRLGCLRLDDMEEFYV